MASREEMIAFLKKQGASEGSVNKTPTRDEMIAFIQQKQSSASDKPQSQPEEKPQDSASFLMDNVVSPIGTALDYTYAPLRQAAAAPAKIALGISQGSLDKTVNAFLDPIAQLGRSPKEAPTSSEVMEMYGVPREKSVSPAVMGNPLMGSTYENNPLPDDAENVTVKPSQQGGALMDAAIGGEGINLAAKGIGKVGAGISKGASTLAEKVSPPRMKLNTEQIRAASERLGIKITPAMLDDSGFVERLEYTLSQSPSMLGQSVARNRNAVIEKMADTSKGLTSEATNMSSSQIGEKFKSGVTAKVGERLDPISAVFNEVAEATKSIPISDNSKNAIIRNIENMDTYKLMGGGGKPGQYVDMISRVENADQVKTMMTLLNQDIRAAQGAEKHVLIGIKEKAKNLENNSIMRAAIKTAREGGMKESTGKSIGTQIVSDLKDARTKYRELSTDLSGVAEAARIKTNKGPSAFLDAVEDVPSEKIQDKFFSVGNNRQLTALQEKFPEQFDLLKRGKLKEIAADAVDHSQAGRGETSTAKFLTAVRELEPEAQQMLFGKDLEKISDLQTVQNSLPRNFNVSNTSNQMGWQDAIMKNVKDVPNYLLYKGASSNLGKNISEKVARLPDFPKLSSEAKQIRDAIAKPSSMISQAKGAEKWANDGINNILKVSDIDRETLEKLKKSPKGQMLLFEASSAKDKKAMEKVLQKIRSANSKGGE